MSRHNKVACGAPVPPPVRLHEPDLRRRHGTVSVLIVIVLFTAWMLGHDVPQTTVIAVLSATGTLTVMLTGRSTLRRHAGAR